VNGVAFENTVSIAGFSLLLVSRTPGSENRFNPEYVRFVKSKASDTAGS
jgi:hypothetical protein